MKSQGPNEYLGPTYFRGRDTQKQWMDYPINLTMQLLIIY